jgi:hypothetical protein
VYASLWMFAAAFALPLASVVGEEGFEPPTSSV